MNIQINNLLKVNASPPDNLKSWLSHSDSLTQKLKDQSGYAKIQVLKQGWTQPTWWDKFSLRLVTDTVIHRDILMFSQKTACWFARTIIPKYSYEQKSSFFDRLSQEPLSVLLFNEPNIIRVVLQNYAINESCLEYHWLPEALKTLTTEKPQTDSATAKNKEFWLRFSVFTIAGSASFYLIEILMPGLIDVIK